MILVTGANGQLGSDILLELNNRGVKNKGIDIKDLDLTCESKVFEYIEKLRPKCIIHCAAYTAVDKAEELKEYEKCFNINVKATEYIAKACNYISSQMVYISTDYVFDGKKDGEYEINDLPNPLSNYGKSKLAGESAVKNNLAKYFIIRTSWLFGNKNTNFINTIISLAKKNEEVNIVNDQIGSPTYSKDLANLVIDIINSDKYGVYHITNEGVCSWAELARLVLKIKNIKCKVNFISSDQFNSKAKRPLNSKLSKNSLKENGFDLLPSWEDAVKRYLGHK
ncbi:dTDP-4-dehydrorhamnose reductase [Clostridium cagae]|uniref:dTDP-4-dehydrorhamnose reductase n=1 Tax=Clostridium cagae TaxID=2080751 RepID=UPI000CF7002C|nr:dTDP-4-dehydrorhamnose reductase [Clostridium cagae]